MSDQPKPTIGRVVLYKHGDQIHPALVTNVHSDTCVNLHVLFDGDDSMPMRSVEFTPDIDSHDGVNGGSRWGWMAYQKAVHTGTTEPTKHA